MGRRLRPFDWQSRLNNYIHEQKKVYFEWGEMDCALFAAGAVLASCEHDFGSEFRGKYRTSRGAASRIKKEGGLRRAVTARLGPEIEPSRARRGDVIMAVVNGREAVGVCLGEASAFKAFHGVTFIPTLSCIAAWEV